MWSSIRFWMSEIKNAKCKSEVSAAMAYDILVGLAAGLVSGLASGWIVYLLTKWREKKYQAYYFCHAFLFDTLKRCEMYIPVDVLRYLSVVGDKSSEWHKAVYQILDDTRPFPPEDRELTEQENRIAENVMIALKELNIWARKNHLHMK